MKKTDGAKLVIDTPIKAAVVKVMVLLSLCLGLAGSSGAASIIQVVDMHYAEHGTTFDHYQPFDPSLGTLDEVVITIIGSAAAGPFDFTNTSISPVTFTGTTGVRFDAAGQPVNITSTFTETLPPGGTDINFHHSVEGGFNVTSFFTSPASLSGFIGPYPLVPNVEFFIGGAGYATASDPSIVASRDRSYLDSLDATETIFYVYTPVPEPPALACAATAALWGLGYAWLRAKCRPARRRS